MDLFHPILSSIFQEGFELFEYISNLYSVLFWKFLTMFDFFDKIFLIFGHTIADNFGNI